MPIALDGTKGITFPTWTTATRPASPAAGQTGFNTTTTQLETYDGTNWEIHPSPTTQGTSGQYLQSAGAGVAPTWATLSSSGALIRAPQILTSGTSYTTPSNCTAIYVEAVGGGGGGGGYNGVGTSGAGGGGGAGAYCAKYFTVTGSTAYTYAIGAAGTAGTSAPTGGGNGGNTTFTVGATTITAGFGSGGGGVGADNNGGGGAGGSATNGDLNIAGQGGSLGSRQATASGLGGSTIFGFGGSMTSGQGNAGSGYGGGGGGCFGSAVPRNGSAGTAGVIRIWEFT